MRFRSLDAVRGIAALVVVFYHAMLILPGAIEDRVALRHLGMSAPFGWVYLTPLRWLVAGPAAVFMFFVLSGFVLTLSLHSGGHETYPRFLVKRVARIWGPFAVVVLGSTLLARIMFSLPLPGGASGWMRGTWADWPGRMMVFRHLAMLGTDFSLDNPMWSLIHEMRVSLVFPLLVMLAQRSLWAMWCGTLALFVVAIELQIRGSPTMIERSWLTTICYLPLFLMGISLALRQKGALALLAGLPRPAAGAAWLAALLGIGYAPVVTSSIVRLNDGILLLGNGVAATALIGLAAGNGCGGRLLLKRWPQWLGKVSYSLYLVHVVVFATILRLLAPLPLWVSIPVSIVLALAVAAVCQRYVERPAAALGRIAAARLGRPDFAKSQAEKGNLPPR